MPEKKKMTPKRDLPVQDSAPPANRPQVRATPPPAPPKAQMPQRFRTQKREAEKPRRVRGGVKIGSLDGTAAGWIRQRVARLVEQAATGEALRDGTEYAELGQTKRMTFEDGLVRASVQGRGDKPYAVTLELEHFEPDERGQIVRAMAEQAVYAAKLLSGEMPANVEDLFAPLGLKLLPTEPGDVTPKCSCRLWSEKSPWCKHAVCVSMLVGERLSSQPFLVFGLRGLPAEDLLESLRDARALPSTGDGPTPVYRAHAPVTEELGAEAKADDSLDRFWTAGPELRRVGTPVDRPEVGHLLLRRLGPSPIEGRFPLVGLLATCYELIGEAALKTDEPGAEAEG